MTDDNSWALEVGDVKPLKGRDKPKTPKSVPDHIQKRQNVGKTIYTPPSKTTKPQEPLLVFSNEAARLSGYAKGVDNKLKRALMRGEVTFTARLDLHGYLEGDAWLELMDFLHAAADTGHRCVLVIHGKGKGYGPKNDMGVIKAQMAVWVAAHPKVLAFHTAQPKDGGSGAMYVYLRKNR